MSKSKLSNLYIKRWRKNHKEQYKILRNNKVKRKYHNDSLFRENCLISRCLTSYLKGKTKTAKRWEEVSGQLIIDLKRNLESKFSEGMNWKNYGKGGWQIDHIKSKCDFDINSLKECWSIENLQPIWPNDNLNKFFKEKGIKLIGN